VRSLHSIADFVRWAASRFTEAGLFFGHGTESALDEAAALVLHALHLPHDLPSSWFSCHLTAQERGHVLELIQRRIELRIPLPYLTGEAWFAGLSFHVNKHVLIPRSPIAELVQNQFSPWVDPDNLRCLLDLCCGSGCIGIASAFYLPRCQVDLVDLSPDALAVSRQNIEAYGLEDRVSTIRSDLLKDVPAKQYDLILSNPPYVSRKEMAELPEEYRHEPVMALQAEEDGLQLVKRILREAVTYLKPHGLLIVEVGNSADVLMERYPDVPLVWLEFAHGGSGVFLISAAELSDYSETFY
jgi:ribosomal protein L3 glutamine methyltransferase